MIVKYVGGYHKCLRDSSVTYLQRHRHNLYERPVSAVHKSYTNFVESVTKNFLRIRDNLGL